MNNNAKRLLKIFIILLIIYAIELVYIHSKNIIIKVDGKNITKTQFNKAFDKNANIPGFLSFGVDIKKDKKSVLYSMIKDKAVNDLIKQALIDEEIEKKHINVDDKEVNKELENIIKKIGSKENFNGMLKQNGISLVQFKSDLREELKKKKLAESISKIAVSDTEARKYYKENLDKFKHDETVKVSHIFIAANPKHIAQAIQSNPKNQNLSDKEIQAEVEQAQAEKLEKAKKLLSTLKNNPALFAKIAKENSDDKMSAKNGGYLGIFKKEQMSPVIAKVVFNTELNKISDIVETPNGYHILIVSDRTKAGVESFEKVKGDIVYILEKQKRDVILDNLANSLRKKAKIKYVNPDYAPKSIGERHQESEQHSKNKSK